MTWLRYSGAFCVGVGISTALPDVTFWRRAVFGVLLIFALTCYAESVRR